MESVKGFVCMEVDGEETSFISHGLSDEAILMLCVLHAIRKSCSMGIPIEYVHQLIDVLHEDCVLVEVDVE